MNKVIQKRFLSPKDVIADLNIQKGEAVIDFGSGSGFWAVEIAKKIGKEGVVYAIDPREENLTVLSNRLKQARLSNVQLYKAPYVSQNMPIKEKADLVIFANVLSFNPNWKSLLTTVKKNTNPGARLLIIDWENEKMMGSFKRNDSWKEEIILAAKEAGFLFSRLIEAGEFHFGLYFESKK